MFPDQTSHGPHMQTEAVHGSPQLDRGCYGRHIETEATTVVLWYFCTFGAERAGPKALV
jgi:hypothetical protein